MKKINIIIITIIFSFLFILPAASFNSEKKENFLETIKDSPQVQEEILSLVVNNLYLFLTEGRTVSVPQESSWILRERSGVFVSLERYGEPRGCRGTLYPLYSSLAEELINASIGAVTRDYRVSPLTFEEFRKVTVTVTIVGEVMPVMSYYEEVDPLIHGIMVQSYDGEKKGVMLPGEGPTQEKQLAWAKKRAGIKEGEPVEMFFFTGVRFSGNVWEILELKRAGSSF